MDSVAQRISAVGAGAALELRGVTRMFGALDCGLSSGDCRPATDDRVIPSAFRHSSNTSSTSASQKSILTGRRRGPFR